ncbi:MAG: ABC transporter permease [Raineya sp.]|jgi:Cu-processing system permease protein|nr:ABC transporter permease [Raineya sp.]
MFSIVRLIVSDIVKNKIVIVYTLLLAILSWSAFMLEDNQNKGILTLLNIILLTIPLVSILFTAIYIYNSNEFIELLVSQPLRRNKIWISLFWGISGSLLFAFLLSTGIPLILFADLKLGLIMLGVGCMITLICVAIAFVSTTFTRDKAKGIGIVIVLWLYFALLFDSLILFILFEFADYPIEKPMLFMVALNPLDIGRILILLHLDVSAMMGYTGAIFREVLGSITGILIAFILLILWTVVPFWISLIKFNHKDL